MANCILCGNDSWCSFATPVALLVLSPRRAGFGCFILEVFHRSSVDRRGGQTCIIATLFVKAAAVAAQATKPFEATRQTAWRARPTRATRKLGP